MKKLIHIALLSFTLHAIDTKQLNHKACIATPSSTCPISQATDTLNETVYNIQSPTSTMDGRKTHDAVIHALAMLHERTWMGDLRGYSEDQITKACQMLELLYAEEEVLKNLIKHQEIKIAEMMDKDLWGPLASVKEGYEEEYKIASIELDNLKNNLARIISAIKNEEIVAGKRYALAIKRAVCIMSTAAAISIAYAIDAYYFDNKGKARLSKTFRDLGTYFGFFPPTTEHIVNHMGNQTGDSFSAAIQGGMDAITTEQAARQAPTIGELREVLKEPVSRTIQHSMKAIIAEQATRKAPTIHDLLEVKEYYIQNKDHSI